jgi:hypothetical protein
LSGRIHQNTMRYHGRMNYTAIYENPFDQDGTTGDGTHVAHEIRLRISSNLALTEDEVKRMLRRHLLERFKIADVKEEKIRIE